MEKGANYSNGKEGFKVAAINDGIAELVSETGVDFLKIKPGGTGYVAIEILEIFLQTDLKNFKQS